MKFEVYSVYDRVAGSYGFPQEYVNAGVAKRAFAEFAKSVPNDSRSDYELVLIGEFDTQTGDVVSVDKVVVQKGGEFVES